MRELLERLGLEGAEVRLAISGARGLTLVVGPRDGRCPSAVVRVHSGDGPSRVAVEHRFLGAIHGHGEPSLSITVPRPLARVPWGAGEAVALTFLEGRPITSPRRVEAFRDRLQHLRVWLSELWAVEAGDDLGPVYRLGPFLDSLETEVGALGSRAARTWDRVRAAARVLDGAAPAICHFDLSPSNVLIRGPVLGVVDWEYARRGAPLYDWFRLVFQMGLGRRRRVVNLSRPPANDAPFTESLRALYFERGELARVVASETVSAVVGAGLDVRLADAAMRAFLLQYLLLQLPWRDRGNALAPLLTEASCIEELI